MYITRAVNCGDAEILVSCEEFYTVKTNVQRRIKKKVFPTTFSSFYITIGDKDSFYQIYISLESDDDNLSIPKF